MGYLVLSRKVDEAIIINHNIRVVVVEIRGDKVRIAVEAPREITVHRDEIEGRIREAQGVAKPDNVPRQKNVALCFGLPDTPIVDQPSGSGT